MMVSEGLPIKCLEQLFRENGRSKINKPRPLWQVTFFPKLPAFSSYLPGHRRWLRMGFAPFACLWFREKTSKQSPSSSLKNTKEKGIMFNTKLQKKHTSKIIIISIDQKMPRELIVPSSSPFVFAPVAPGSPPEGLFLFMAGHSTSMFPINVSTALLNASFGRWRLGDWEICDLEENTGKNHCYENADIWVIQYIDINSIPTNQHNHLYKSDKGWKKHCWYHVQSVQETFSHKISFLDKHLERNMCAFWLPCAALDRKPFDYTNKLLKHLGLSMPESRRTWILISLQLIVRLLRLKPSVSICIWTFVGWELAARLRLKGGLE